MNWELIGAIILPLIGGWISSMSMNGQVKNPDGKAWYQLLKKPSWTPPDWVFGPVWAFLYPSMGWASFIVFNKYGGLTEDNVLPLMCYGGQLILNWTWTPIFFGLHKLGWALAHMIVLDIITVLCTIYFFDIMPLAAYLMVPYLAWLTFSTSLNYTIWRLNQEERRLLSVN